MRRGQDGDLPACVLQAVGFDVAKVPGHGRKKERLEARLVAGEVFGMRGGDHVIGRRGGARGTGMLRLLRDGAHTTITTRFPRDAVRRFSALPDSADWIDRLKIVFVDGVFDAALSDDLALNYIFTVTKP